MLIWTGRSRAEADRLGRSSEGCRWPLAHTAVYTAGRHDRNPHYILAVRLRAHGRLQGSSAGGRLPRAVGKS